MITGAYIYDSCVSARIAAAAAADYISKRSAAVERCSNSTQYWPGNIGLPMSCCFFCHNVVLMSFNSRGMILHVHILC